MIVTLMHTKIWELYKKLENLGIFIFSNRQGVVKNSTKLYIFLDLAKYYFI